MYDDDCLINAESHGFSKEICRSMVAMLDADHSGKLEMEEFKLLFNDVVRWKVFQVDLTIIWHSLSMSYFQNVFKLHDHDRNNKIKVSEFREALESSGYHLTNGILNSLVNRYGSRDKTIEFEDFIMCAVKVKTMISHYQEKDFNGTNNVAFSINEWISKAICSWNFWNKSDCKKVMNVLSFNIIFINTFSLKVSFSTQDNNY